MKTRRIFYIFLFVNSHIDKEKVHTTGSNTERPLTVKFVWAKTIITSYMHIRVGRKP